MEHFDPKPIVIAHPAMGVGSHIAEMYAQGTVDIIMADSKEIKSSTNFFAYEPYTITNTIHPTLYTDSVSKRRTNYTPPKKKRKKKK